MTSEKPEPAVQKIVSDLGTTDYNRRLSDKVLNAFNHACAAGRQDVAEHLERALNICVTEEADGRNITAMDKAGLWRLFVETRDRYRDIRNEFEADAPQVQEALNAMKESYMAWSKH